MIDPAFAYAQARMQARHGRRPDEATWQHLHTSHSLEHFVSAARATSASPLGVRWWIDELPVEDADAIEDGLRQKWHAHVAEVASWLPPRWQPAVSWLETLVDLPTPRQDDGDSALSQILEGDPATIAERWVARWRSLWPRTLPGHRRRLNALQHLVGEHHRAMADADPQVDGWKLRAALQRELVRCVRRHPDEPVAVFCHLGLAALDLERLRGALLRRLLLPDVRSSVSWV